VGCRGYALCELGAVDLVLPRIARSPQATAMTQKAGSKHAQSQRLPSIEGEVVRADVARCHEVRRGLL
jgi:hypothetical protein